LFEPDIPRSIELRNIVKYEGNDGSVYTRVKSAEETLDKITAICREIGVTRISDITYLDKLYIPNYSAVLPGTQDSIWVYSGKGPTKVQAKVGALMESVERYCALSSRCSINPIQGTYSQLSKIYDKVLHPYEVIESVEEEYDDNESVAFLPGFDILKNEKVLVPAELAMYKFSPPSPSIRVFSYSHTNGLASGNIIEEAICHALCEVIERDAASIADLCSSDIPYSILKNIMNSVNNVSRSETVRISADKFVDDSSLFPEVNVSDITKEFEPIKFLVKKFAEKGISLMVKYITQKDIDIPTFVASSIEWVSSSYGYFAKGYGTHPDARIAMIRAITELSQTRAVNIQGARDDLRKIMYKENDEIYKRKWQFMKSTCRDHKCDENIVMFSEIKTYVKRGILDDINLILNRLKKAGLKRVIVVDITDPQIGIPVVRVIVPGLETFEVAKLYSNTNLFIGKRAKKQFQTTVNS
jgi:ribosomal protein S12 methylthiotransferase accessory factor